MSRPRRSSASSGFVSSSDDLADALASEMTLSVSLPLPSFSRPTHGSYIPPTGAPGFAGDHTWEHTFSDTLVQYKSTHPPTPILTNRYDTTTHVLTEDMAHLIRPHLPALTRLPRHWTLLYSLDQHGISLNTLYARCEPRIPSRAHPNPPKGGLLVIKDARDAIFGAWLAEGIKLEKAGYYGSGESFLWRYHPPEDKDSQARLDVYNWTARNAYVALCQPGFISFGGGDGHYGLYLDQSLLDGSSAPCPTFANPPLCATPSQARLDVPFECVGLEVWGIGQA